MTFDRFRVAHYDVAALDHDMTLKLTGNLSKRLKGLRSIYRRGLVYLAPSLMTLHLRLCLNWDRPTYNVML